MMPCCYAIHVDAGMPLLLLTLLSFSFAYAIAAITSPLPLPLRHADITIDYVITLFSCWLFRHYFRHITLLLRLPSMPRC